MICFFYCLLIAWILYLILSPFWLWILIKISMSVSNFMILSDMFTPHTVHPLLLLRTDVPVWMTLMTVTPFGFQLFQSMGRASRIWERGRRVNSGCLFPWFCPHEVNSLCVPKQRIPLLWRTCQGSLLYRILSLLGSYNLLVLSNLPYKWVIT